VNDKKRLIIGAILLVIAIIVYVSGVWRFISLARIQEHHLYLMELVQQHYFTSVALYLLIFVTAAAFSIPITILLTIAAGAFFGVLWGTIYAIIGATVGAALSFVAFRYFFGSIVQKTCATQLTRLNANIDQYGANYLLTLQLLPITPTILINTLAGLTKISLWTFVWTTSLGILPGSLIYTFAGRQLANVHSVRDLVSGSMLALFVLLAFFALIPIFMRSKRGRFRL